ncbi:hypothetical protein [Streptomyces xiamenensis]|uniref:hypothetical protein n=1 Tax=Streptomyces xiamenensis TaxID=408015 RepID=UPI0037D5F607
MRPLLLGCIAVTAALLVGMSIIMGERGSHATGGRGTPPVEYRVTGAGASSVTTDCMMPGGGMVWKEGRPLPVSDHQWAVPGERLYQWAMFRGDGTITCEILVEGEPIITKTAEGEEPSVVCDAETSEFDGPVEQSLREALALSFSKQSVTRQNPYLQALASSGLDPV